MKKINFIKTSFIVFIIFLSSCVNEKRTNTDYLIEISVKELQKGYSEGKYTIEQVVKDYLKRIEEIDENGPGLNSIISINPNAIAIARELDKELKDGKIRGPLHGIPVILKDNIDTRDSMPTTGGATVLEGNFAKEDSHIAKLLRESGAIIIAKANLSEWANFRANISSSGWSGVGEQTGNPYELDRNPCGSSSGSGAAVSANLCAISVGTETNGSIVCPSNNNGIVGIKPTVGLLSRTGIIPISFTQDTPGPMARSVEDAAVMLGVMAGKDTSDLMTLNPNARFVTDYTEFLNKDGLKGKRIGLLTNVSGFHFKVDELMKRVVEDLKKNGAEVIELSFPVPREVSAASFQVLLYEFKDGLNRYFEKAGVGSKVKSIAELIEFNKKDSVELRYFDQELLIMAQSKGDLNQKEYTDAIKTMQKGMREDGIDKIMNSYKLDALLAPTGTPAWKTDLVNGDNFLGSSSSYAAIAGYPSINVPAGFIEGLPVGISFFGRAWSEPLLIEIAYSYEQATKHRKAPEFR